MNVHGYAISEAVEMICLNRMQKDLLFSAYDIEHIARKAGVPGTHKNNPIAMRFADRLIQRERRAGMLIRVGRMWQWKMSKK